MDIKFEIISRGSMRIYYGERVAMISGELTFEPPVFYADLSSFKNWESPHEKEIILEKQVDEIISYLIHSDNATKIIFE